MTDELGSSSTKIQKLNDSNYHFWKQKIVLFLALKDLGDLLQEDPPISTTSDTASSSPENSNGTSPQIDTAMASWKIRDRQARAIVGLSLPDEHLEHVRDVKTAKSMWKTIIDVFERHTLVSKLSARRKFYTITMERGEKVLAYLYRVEQLDSTLKSMKVEIDDKELVMATLNGPPSSYESLIVALDALGNDDETFIFDLVKSRLLQEEQWSSERERVIPPPKPSALVGVSGRSNGG